MSTELLQIFFALLIEIVLLTIALIYPDKRRQLVIVMIITAIVGGVILAPQAIAAFSPPPKPTATSTPSSFVNPITHIYDDFNNSANDRSFDRSRWSISGDPNTCNVFQIDGHLRIENTALATYPYSGCFLRGPLDGVGGSKFELFEARILVVNDFQGTDYSGIGLMLSSNSFSGGGGYIKCAIDAGPGSLAGVLSITHGEKEREYFQQVNTTYNNWHTLRLEIDQTNYEVSCFIDDTLIGSVIPEDAANLYQSTYSRYIQLGWPQNTSVTFEVDDVKIIP